MNVVSSPAVPAAEQRKEELPPSPTPAHTLVAAVHLDASLLPPGEPRMSNTATCNTRQHGDTPPAPSQDPKCRRGGGSKMKENQSGAVAPEGEQTNAHRLPASNTEALLSTALQLQNEPSSREYN